MPTTNAATEKLPGGRAAAFAAAAVIAVTLGLAAPPARGSDTAEGDRESYVRRAVMGRPLPDNVKGKKQTGSGSGFFVNKSDIVTNHHVVDECTSVTVRVGDQGDWLSATVIASDPSYDLAALRADTSVAHPAVFAHENAAFSKDLTVIGFPEMGRVTVRPVTLKGTLIGDPTVQKAQWFQVRAKVRRGNSGSPVLDEHGRVRGVVTKKVNPVTRYKTTGKLQENIGIAVAASAVRRFLSMHQIEHAVAGAGDLTKASLSEAARHVTQVGCWK